MGCICSKGVTRTPSREQGEVHRRKSSKFSRRHVVSSRREEASIHAETPPGNDSVMARLISTSQENSVTPPQIAIFEGKNKVPVPIIVDRPIPQRMISHRRRATVDIGAGDVESVQRINHVPNGAEAELVAAGWPSWLTSVAGDAIKGWVPLKANRYVKIEKIGQGTYSNVFKARDFETNEIVALKKVRFVNMDPESVRFMAREIYILRKLDHPNVIKLRGLITAGNSSTLYLVFDYMKHDLAGLAATPGIKFTEAQVKCYMQQLLNGLDHCHSRGILHRDIKGSNLLLDDDGIIRIADFGLATTFKTNQKQPLTSRVVTLWYRPPELLLGATEYDVSVDLWSTGCILAELLAGKPIMPGRTEVEQMHKIFKLCGSPSEEYWRNSKLPHTTIFKPQHPYRRCVREMFKDFSSSALDLLDVLLAIKPEDRGTAASALSSTFFTTKPYACDPSSLPKYPPSKEYDAKLRDEEKRSLRAAVANGDESEYATNGLRGNKGMADSSTHLPSLQKTQTQLNAYTGNQVENHRRQSNVRHGTIQNVFSHSGPLLHPDAFGFPSIMRTKDNTGTRPVPNRSSSTVKGLNEPVPEFRTQRSYLPQGGYEDFHTLPGQVSSRQTTRPDNHGDRIRDQQLDVVEASDMQGWPNQILDMPSSSHRNGDRRGGKEHMSGYGSRRIHYSGPLVPPGVNTEEMLREHERQIQQAVRKARFNKAYTNRNIANQRPA